MDFSRLLINDKILKDTQRTCLVASWSNGKEDSLLSSVLSIAVLGYVLVSYCYSNITTHFIVQAPIHCPIVLQVRFPACLDGYSVQGLTRHNQVVGQPGSYLETLKDNSWLLPCSFDCQQNLFPSHSFHVTPSIFKPTTASQVLLVLITSLISPSATSL